MKKSKFWAKQRRKNVFLGFLRQYLRKTLRRLAVLLRLSSNLQDRRLLYCKRCTNNKIDHFRPKRNKFWAKQRRKKTCFLGFLRHYLRKTLRKFAVMLRLSLNLQGSRPLDGKRWPNIKKDHFAKKKVSFGPNNVAKTCFLGFLRQYLRKTLRRLAVLLRLSSNLQDRRLLYCKRCTNNKIDHFRSKRNKFWTKQRRKKTCFLGFLRHYLRKTLRKFAVLFRLS